MDLQVVELRDGRLVIVRPIRPDDAGRLSRMFTRLSPETVYRRFFSPVVRFPKRTLEYLSEVDHDRREALVAQAGDEVVGVARYDTSADGHTAEIAVTVEDAWQHSGLGKRLTALLAREAQIHGIDGFAATVLPDNRPALNLIRRMSPEAQIRFDSGDYVAEMPIAGTGQR